MIMLWRSRATDPILSSSRSFRFSRRRQKMRRLFSHHRRLALLTLAVVIVLAAAVVLVRPPVSHAFTLIESQAFFDPVDVAPGQTYRVRVSNLFGDQAVHVKIQLRS